MASLGERPTDGEGRRWEEDKGRIRCTVKPNRGLRERAAGRAPAVARSARLPAVATYLKSQNGLANVF